jgi:hypothetical protein
MMRASACLDAVHASELIMLSLLLLAAARFPDPIRHSGSHGANTRRTQDSRVCTAVCDIAAVGTIV